MSKKAKATAKRGVGTAAIEAIRAGKDNAEVLAAVMKEFPDAKTTLASINWYRNNLRAAGEKIPTARELKAKAKPTAKAKGKAKGKTKPAKPAKKTDKDPLDL